MCYSKHLPIKNSHLKPKVIIHVIVLIALSVTTALVSIKNGSGGETGPPYQLMWTQVNDSGGLGDMALGVAVDTTNMYVVGSEAFLSENRQWRIERRNLTDGTTTWIQINNPSNSNDSNIYLSYGFYL